MLAFHLFMDHRNFRIAEILTSLCGYTYTISSQRIRKHVDAIGEKAKSDNFGRILLKCSEEKNWNMSGTRISGIFWSLFFLIFC